jgi:hypothetical protein
MNVVEMQSMLEKIAASLEKSLDQMTTISTQNAELRTLVLALQERLAHVEASHGERLGVVERWKNARFVMIESRLIALEARIPQDRGIGRSP